MSWDTSTCKRTRNGRRIATLTIAAAVGAVLMAASPALARDRRDGDRTRIGLRNAVHATSLLLLAAQRAPIVERTAVYRDGPRHGVVKRAVARRHGRRGAAMRRSGRHQREARWHRSRHRFEPCRDARHDHRRGRHQRRGH